MAVITTRQAVRGLARYRPTQAALLRLAAARGRSLVLCYHRIARELNPEDATPTHSVAELRAHIEAVQRYGPVVSLDELIEGTAPTPSFVLTFDDDYASHTELALPILRQAGVTATFFLSGRALQGRGRYWWQVLDATVASLGATEVARRLGIAASSARDIAARIRETGDSGFLKSLDDGEPELVPADIQALAATGMSIGFHTVDHQVLTALDRDGLSEALTFGRRDIEDVLGGHTIRHFSYPHGRAGAREAAAAQQAGYASASTTSWAPFSAKTSSWRVGRWDPPAMPIRTFAGRVGLRLNAPLDGDV